MTTNEIREKFLSYFRGRNHTVVPSDSLVPSGDPSLLFTSAGMVQFKKHFLRQTKLDYVQAASCQKCLRTSDIDQVGNTARHLTFFEMLGNFSFGGYFKSEAIDCGWEFLTEKCGLIPAQLYASVYKEDEEAFSLWKKFLPESRIVRLGDDSNFWNMGATGPCGPCSEILYDRGESFSADHACAGPGCSCDRYLEIWNLVFTQFDRTTDGKLIPLPQKNIDTGMGLERLSMVLQDADSTYEIDIFKNLISAIEEDFAGPSNIPQRVIADKKVLRIISDHIRACTFLISDGILPSNEGRGYILRRLLRRALRQGWLEGKREPFLYKLASIVTNDMKDVYPELVQRLPNIESVVQTEEKNALETIEVGTRTLEAEIKALGKTQGRVGKVKLSGKKVFTIYDTYGLGKEIQSEILRDWGGELDFSEEEYEIAREKASETARRGWKGSGEKEILAYSALQKKVGNTVFRGYDVLECETKVVAILKSPTSISPGQVNIGMERQETLELIENEEGEIVLSETPFYAESGGQVGDRGSISKGTENYAEVLDTQKPVENIIVHTVKVQRGKIRVQDMVSAQVNRILRQHTMRHHTATHLLHAALRKVVGNQVTQAGSLISPEKLRFDFTAPKALTEGQIDEIERDVNTVILSNITRQRTEGSLDEARQQGALAFFGEKYGAKVFVVKYADASTEVCGGTHCGQTGDIGFFKILSESSVGSGVRRIEAVAGEKALLHIQEQQKQVQVVLEKLKCTLSECPQKIEKMVQAQTESEKALLSMRKKKMGINQHALLQRAKTFSFGQKLSNGEIKILAEEVESADTESFRETADALRDQLGSGVVLLAARADEKISFIVTVTKDCIKKGVHAGDIARDFAKKIAGRGGGKDAFAQGGGELIPDLTKILESYPERIIYLLNEKNK